MSFIAFTPLVSYLCLNILFLRMNQYKLTMPVTMLTDEAVTAKIWAILMWCSEIGSGVIDDMLFPPNISLPATAM